MWPGCDGFLSYPLDNFSRAHTAEAEMFPDIFKVKDRVALVTGGSKGLGKAMARGLAEAGADIVISSRHEDELRPASTRSSRGPAAAAFLSSPTWPGAPT